MIGQNLTPGPTNSEKVQQLQAALHTKAKDEPRFRFYALYDKIYREDVLHVAFEKCRKNAGKPGVDGQSFEQIAEYGVERWLGELAEELRTKRYQPQAVRRVWIPKADGKQRPLGIPTIKDRVVQTAVLSILEPIFEADLLEEQYAYRKDKRASEAADAVQLLAWKGRTSVIDADLSDYFGSIPHAELMECVAARVSDSRVLALVKAWLVAPVEEKDGRGNTQRTTRNKDEGRGTPQGAPLSPLLANLYMRKFILAWKREGAYFKAKIINYADDFVILCSYRADRALQVMTDLLTRMKLTVNAAKTRVCKLPDESFNFLGYTFGNYWSWRKQRMQLSRRPSPQSLKRVKAKLTALTSRRQTQLDVKTMVQRLNRQLVGWANYFSQGTVVQAFRSVDRHVGQRLRQWLGAKHKQSGLRHDLYPHSYLYDRLGLISITKRQLATVREQHGCGD